MSSTGSHAWVVGRRTLALALAWGGVLAACQPVDQHAPASAATASATTASAATASADAGQIITARFARAQPELERFVMAEEPRGEAAFGAAVGLAGERMVVIAALEEAESDGILRQTSGAIYSFERDSGRWVMSNRVPRPDARDGDGVFTLETQRHARTPFAYQMSFSGPELFVGMVAYDGQTPSTKGSIEDSGAVNVYWRTDGTLELTQRLQAPEPGAQDHFGYRTAVSGPWLAVSAVSEDGGRGAGRRDDRAIDSGAVFMFVRREDGWRYHSTIKAEGARPGDRFGSSLALDGDLLIVGAMHESAVAGEPRQEIPQAGGVHLFRLNHALEKWELEARIPAIAPQPKDAFGCALAFSDGRLAIGGWAQGRGPGMLGGRVYVLRAEGDQWLIEGTFKSNDPSFLFGAAVALRGGTLWVSAPAEVNDDDVRSGVVYVFTLGDGIWKLTHRLVPSNGDADDLFGTDLAISDTHVAIGAPGKNLQSTDNRRTTDGSMIVTKNAGAVYVYRY